MTHWNSDSFKASLDHYLTTPPDEDNDCKHCGRDYDNHSDEQHDECDLKTVMEDMPKTGLRFLVYRPDAEKNSCGCWDWIDLDGLNSNGIDFVKMAIKEGEILEDLG